MSTTIEIAENVLTRSIENLKNSSDTIVADVIKDLETSRVLMRIQRLLEVGYTTYQLADAFRIPYQSMSPKRVESLKIHHQVHSDCGKSKPELSRRCNECLMYQYSVGWYGENPQKIIQEKIIQEIESNFEYSDIVSMVKFIESIKAKPERLRRIKMHKRFNGVLSDAHDPYNCELCIAYPLLFPIDEMSYESEMVMNEWIQKYIKLTDNPNTH